MLFEVAIRPRGTWFFLPSPLFFFSHFQLPFILFYLLPAAFSLPSWLTLPPFRDHYVVELYLSASLLIFSTKGTLVILLCLLPLIHNYLASHRRTRCISLISSLSVPPLFMQKGCIWLSVHRLKQLKNNLLGIIITEEFFALQQDGLLYSICIISMTENWTLIHRSGRRVTGQLVDLSVSQPPFTSWAYLFIQMIILLPALLEIHLRWIKEIQISTPSCWYCYNQSTT